jgi:hypothetical protein
LRIAPELLMLVSRPTVAFTRSQVDWQISASCFASGVTERRS